MVKYKKRFEIFCEGLSRKFSSASYYFKIEECMEIPIVALNIKFNSKKELRDTKVADIVTPIK